jgi:hypothetical protein
MVGVCRHSLDRWVNPLVLSFEDLTLIDMVWQGRGEQLDLGGH